MKRIFLQFLFLWVIAALSIEKVEIEETLKPLRLKKKYKYYNIIRTTENPLIVNIKPTLQPEVLSSFEFIESNFIESDSESNSIEKERADFKLLKNYDIGNTPDESRSQSQELFPASSSKESKSFTSSFLPNNDTNFKLQNETSSSFYNQLFSPVPLPVSTNYTDNIFILQEPTREIPNSTELIKNHRNYRKHKSQHFNLINTSNFTTANYLKRNFSTISNYYLKPIKSLTFPIISFSTISPAETTDAPQSYGDRWYQIESPFDHLAEEAQEKSFIETEKREEKEGQKGFSGLQMIKKGLPLYYPLSKSSPESSSASAPSSALFMNLTQLLTPKKFFSIFKNNTLSSSSTFKDRIDYNSKTSMEVFVSKENKKRRTFGMLGGGGGGGGGGGAIQGGISVMTKVMATVGNMVNQGMKGVQKGMKRGLARLREKGRKIGAMFRVACQVIRVLIKDIMYFMTYLFRMNFNMMKGGSLSGLFGGNNQEQITPYISDFNYYPSPPSWSIPLIDMKKPSDGSWTVVTNAPYMVDYTTEGPKGDNGGNDDGNNIKAQKAAKKKAAVAKKAEAKKAILAAKAAAKAQKAQQNQQNNQQNNDDYDGWTEATNTNNEWTNDESGNNNNNNKASQKGSIKAQKGQTKAQKGQNNNADSKKDDQDKNNNNNKGDGGGDGGGGGKAAIIAGKAQLAASKAAAAAAAKAQALETKSQALETKSQALQKKAQTLKEKGNNNNNNNSGNSGNKGTGGQNNRPELSWRTLGFF